MFFVVYALYKCFWTFWFLNIYVAWAQVSIDLLRKLLEQAQTNRLPTDDRSLKKGNFSFKSANLKENKKIS